MTSFLETEEWVKNHEFALPDHSGEKKIRYVILITAVMMVAEIISGIAFGSMSLLADGWHMGTHVLALGVAFFAYQYARKHAKNPAFAFGTGKTGVLGGFASAVMLGFAAILIGFESAEKFLDPEQIKFNEAMAVAAIGLAVNLASAVLLHQGHGHNDHYDDDHSDHNHGHSHDHNLKAAYFHVAADALTSLTAIFALAAGKFLGWTWLDPFMGVVGSLVILKWSHGLVKDTSGLLLDYNENMNLVHEVEKLMVSDGETRVLDLHLWRINPAQYAAVLTVSSDRHDSFHYRNRLKSLKDIIHVNIEVNSTH